MPYSRWNGLFTSFKSTIITLKIMCVVSCRIMKLGCLQNSYSLLTSRHVRRNFGGCDLTPLNDMTNLFLTTVTALCDSGMPDAKLANIVDAFQHVIRTGLLSMDCPPFQSASCLVILRISLKLNLNRELVFGWIDCLLKRTRPENAWEMLRVINKLMRAQHIALLPTHLTEKHSTVLGMLTSAERKLIEDEEASLLNQFDANALAAEAMTSESSGVRSKTLVRPVTPIYSTQFVQLVLFLCTSLTLVFFIPKQFMDVELSRSEVPSRISGSPDDSSLVEYHSEVQVAHALLASLPGSGGVCLFGDSGTCVCPKLSEVHCDQNWLRNLIMLVVSEPLLVTDSSKLPKRNVHRARQLLQFVRLSTKAHINVCSTPPSPPHTRASSQNKSPGSQRPCTSSALFSKSERLLESGLDLALPLLFTCLLHPASSVRTDVYSLLTSWFSKLHRLGWNSPGAPNLRKALMLLGTNTSDSSTGSPKCTLSANVFELLRGDPLPMLSKSAPILTRLTVNLLFSEPLPRISSTVGSKYALVCWAAGLKLLSEDTIHELFSIRPTNSDSLVGWSGFLHLLRTPDENYAALQSICLSHLNSALFVAISAMTRSDSLSGRPSLASSQTPTAIPVESPQTDVLDALCDLGFTDSANFAILGTSLNRLNLTVDHFDYLLLKLDAAGCLFRRCVNKSLFTRVAETREARRRHAKESNLIKNELNSIETVKDILTPENPDIADVKRLRLLGIITTILSESVSRLKQPVPESKVHSKDPMLKVVAQLTPDSRVKSKSTSSPAGSGISFAPVLHLLTPLVNHLIGLLSQEQRFTKLQTYAPDVVSSSDSDSDDECSTSQPRVANFLSTSDGPNRPLLMDITTDDSQPVSALDVPCVRTLVRSCVQRLLACMIAILAEGNRTIQSNVGKRLRPTAVSNNRSVSSALLAAQSAVGPVFQCLTVYPDWTALHQQVLLCFIELSAMFPVALCPRLIGMIQWIAANERVMRLDNVHSLALLGRLVVIAVPALVRASTSQTKAALQVVVLFVDGFPGLASHLPRRRLAFYTGLVRGLAQVTGPLALESLASPLPRSSSKADKSDRKAERQQQRTLLERCKESWISSWLWAISLVFLSRDWKEEVVADQVVPLLVDIHNQFPWDKQVAAWCECLGFLFWLTKNSEQLTGENKCPIRFKRHFILETPSRKLQVVDTEIAPPPKRQRTASRSELSEIPTSIPPEDICSSNVISVHVAEALVSTLFKSKVTDELTPVNSSVPPLNPSTVWSLTGRAVQLLTTLLTDPTYGSKLEAASGDPLGLSAVYGRLVQQIVHLMIAAASIMARLKPTDESLSDCTVLLEGTKRSLAGLQTVLMQFILETPSRKLQVVDTEIAPPPKRQRTASRSELSEIPTSIPPEDICSSNVISVHVAEALVSTLFKSKVTDELTPVNSSVPPLNPSTVWSLTGRAVQLLTTLLTDPTYGSKLEAASGDPLGLSAVYGRLVQQIVHLMIAAASIMARLKPTDESLSDCTVLLEGTKRSLAGLQTVLMQVGRYHGESASGPVSSKNLIHDSVSGHIFIRMVSDLFESLNQGLRRKALDLLAAKLTSFTTTCEPIAILEDPALCPSAPGKKKCKKHRHLHAQVDLTLEAGLVQLTAQLASQYSQPEAVHSKTKETKCFGSSFHRQCLSCLRDLAKLLAHRYPGEFMRTLDILIASPENWWPVQHKVNDTDNAVEPRGSGVAESRSLNCLFFVECLQRLPSQSLCPNASATTHRLGVLLHFALDHCLTSCRLSQGPLLILNDLKASNSASNTLPHLVIGLVHSRDQHLQYVTDIVSLLPILQRVIASALATSNAAILQGCFIFLGDLAESAKPSSTSNVIHSTKAQLTEEMLHLSVTQPELLRDTLASTLRVATRISRTNQPSLHSALHRALASLLSAVPGETRLRLCTLLIQWVTNTSKKSSSEEVYVCKVLNRLSLLYHVFTDLSNRIATEEFSELSKQISLVDYLVLTFHILSGHNRKSFRRLGEKLHLKSCVGRLSRGVPAEALEAALSAVGCLRRWLVVEVENTNSLDVGSGGVSLLELPSAFIALLDITRLEDAEEVVKSPAITDSQLTQTLDALVDSISGDEALLRPLGSALAHRITQGVHWSVRLSAIRLLKRTFDRLSNGDEAGMSTAHCLVSDALTALSEALEDDRPEVETAANKLFAELEQSGLTSRNESV
ncbi:hypothetical protein T265_05613 [Opisthorchis viverrini]|uniref:Uncharacterized protein n=1 Tax=Opisthorchis viverrini TaxID=6198 RepID=A0A074ZNE8_OPIVI|nr:hypothetical protein T265_05613 [Opisthorchis viverrini]KER27287.1 hypothetical protein T265_05613 [Opisthorchis viverrini]